MQFKCETGNQGRSKACLAYLCAASEVDLKRRLDSLGLLAGAGRYDNVNRNSH